MLHNTDSETEKLIKEAAKKVFFSQGKIHANMQEIADEAGVNRALLHYYFRNRERLLLVILEEAMIDSHQVMIKVLTSNMSLEDKIKSIIDYMIDRFIDHPYMQAFIINEVTNNENSRLLHERHIAPFFNQLLEEIEKLIIQNNLAHKNSRQFLINLMSLMHYPLISKKIISNIFNYSEDEYNQFIMDRKEIILNVMLQRKN